MTLKSGTPLGPYVVTASLGAGGMGEVYKATDTRLNRSVAIKVLPSDIAADPQFRARFEREARTLAALSHRHICSIHDVGVSDGVNYLVMEYLDGETLAGRLRLGRLPIADALAVAMAIADGLDAAHRAGVIHRDLKPANIMLTKDGAKLLDFGLAKLRTTAAVADLSTQVTPPCDLTRKGAILGTFAYMSPEQVEGRDVDARSDIFAFGAVLFEMLTARRAFEGSTPASIAGAILRDVPPAPSSLVAADQVRIVGAGVLQNLDYTVRRCVAKNPDDRWQSARDLMLHLKWIADGEARPEALPTPRAHSRRREITTWTVAGIAIAALLGSGWMLRQRPAAPEPVLRFSIGAPEGAVFAPATSLSAPHPAIAPDGLRVAFLAQVGTEPVRLWVRSLDTLAAYPLAGTTGAAYPFWSPDGRALGFFADGALKTITMDGGAAQRLCTAPNGQGGAWNREGTILFASGAGGGLSRVTAAGGVPTAVTTPAGSSVHRWPSFLPDGKHFFFHENDGVSLASLDAPAARVVTKADSQAIYSAAGYLLFMRGSTLMAQRFDAAALTLLGNPMPIAEAVSRAISHGAFAVSDTGALLYRSVRAINRQLTWFARDGTPLGTVGGVHDFNGVHLSPDGRKVAYHRHDGRPDGDVWIIDLARGTGERLTHVAENLSPLWSPDGARLVYASNRDSGVNDLWIKSVSATGDETLLLKSTSTKSPRSWSPDGSLVAYETVGARSDIWMLPLAGERTPYGVLQSAFNERGPAFSPDGSWLAYSSDESGRDEVYVRSFPNGEGRRLISTGGGVTPRWRGDNRELLYELDRALWAVPIQGGPSGLEIGEPHRLFDLGAGSAGWDVTRDGRRILVGRGVDDHVPGAMTLTINWTSALRD